MNHYFTNNEQLKSERRVIKYNYDSSCFEFLSDNGVFSKNKIDYGSNILVDTLIKNKGEYQNFLDVGCGYGFITILVSKLLNIPGVGVDINKRAIHLAEENVKLNKVSVSILESNIYENVCDKYDLIITNPPIRAGKQIVLQILKEASCHLNKDGELWFVIRKNQGAKSIIKELEALYKLEVKEKSKGFYVVLAKN